MMDDVTAGPSGPYEERDVYMDMPDGPYTHMRRGLLHGTTPGMKLIHFGGRQYQLYDLASDPGETRDLAGDPAALGPMVDALPGQAGHAEGDLRQARQPDAAVTRARRHARGCRIAIRSAVTGSRRRLWRPSLDHCCVHRMGITVQAFRANEGPLSVHVCVVQDFPLGHSVVAWQS